MFKAIIATTLSLSLGIAACALIGGVMGITASVAMDKYQERKLKKQHNNKVVSEQ